MKRVLCGLAAVFVSFAALAEATPAGLWKTIDDSTKKERSYVRITDAGGVLSAKLEKLIDTPEPEKLVCDKCTDDRKDKPLLGLQLIRGVKKSDEADSASWDGGTILDPANGKTYKVRLTPIEGGKKLQVRGYIGAPMFGRTQVWVRAE
jgi:uncharacterized protein (DUF2147 family)